jgi:hypothetical protein
LRGAFGNRGQCRVMKNHINTGVRSCDHAIFDDTR